MTLPPTGALFDDIPHPPQRLNVVDQCRQAEQTDLERKWRLVARQPALSFQALQQRRFFAANVGTGPAPQMHFWPAKRKLCDLLLQDFAASRIFVAQIDIDVACLDDMRAD